jgi:RNA polymerase sigma-70 factor (ECF subfamily)
MYVLFRFEGLKQAQIADLFGMSKSTVEKEVTRAALHIHRRLQGQ